MIAMKRVINFVVESVAYFKHFSEKGFGPITLIVLFIGFLHARMRKNLTILELYAFNIIYEASQKMVKLVKLSKWEGKYDRPFMWYVPIM